MKLFHFGRNICSLDEIIFPYEQKKKKKRTRKINQGDVKKSAFVCNDLIL